MHLQALYLHHFRAYKEAYFEFSPRINVIHGLNAVGKTTLLEAIYFLITGRSFRTSQVSDLVHIGAAFFYIEAVFVKHGIEQKLKVWGSGKERKVIYNSTQCPPATLLGLLQGVVMIPDDISLIKGAPNGRRHFLDLQLAQIDPLYVHHLTRYNRAMQQRNALLRTKNLVTIESWEHEMANAAAYVTQQRALATIDLQDRGKELYHHVSGDEKLSIAYKTGAGLGGGSDFGPEAVIDKTLAHLRHYYLSQFQKMRKREVEIGYTLTGPHKDDLDIAIDEKEARFFASEGQQRSCVAALRLSEWERLQSLAQESPLMLIDDPGTSLDADRGGRLFTRLKNLGQVFLTSPQVIQLDIEQKNIMISRDFHHHQ